MHWHNHQRLHGYIGGIVRNTGSVLLAVGGVEDHVHLRVSLGRIPSYNPSQQIARAVGSQLMSVQGPLTRSLRDARLALAAMEKNLVEGAQNVQWALLNLSEFLYNF